MDPTPTRSEDRNDAAAAGDDSAATSWTLVESARRGDEASCRRLFRLYEPLVRARYLAGVPAQDLDELVQEIFKTLFQRLDDFQRRDAAVAFRPWLYRIARNKVGDYLRRRSREVLAAGGTDVLNALAQVPDPFPPELDDSDTPDSPAAEVAFHRRLIELVSQEFAPRTWEAASAVLAGQDVATVAASLGMTTNAVRIAKSRVAGRIRDLLRELGESPRLLSAC